MCRSVSRVLYPAGYRQDSYHLSCPGIIAKDQSIYPSRLSCDNYQGNPLLQGRDLFDLSTRKVCLAAEGYPWHGGLLPRLFTITPTRWGYLFLWHFLYLMITIRPPGILGVRFLKLPGLSSLVFTNRAIRQPARAKVTKSCVKEFFLVNVFTGELILVLVGQLSNLLYHKFYFVFAYSIGQARGFNLQVIFFNNKFTVVKCCTLSE